MRSGTNSEEISRFILEKSKFSPNTSRINYRAFLPKDGKTSIFCISGLKDNDVWKLGTEFVASPQGKVIKARADLLSKIVLEQNLQIKPAPIPHPRHADIVGWPQSKDERKMKAIVLAEYATLQLPS